jgi:hypothetical protein
LKQVIESSEIRELRTFERLAPQVKAPQVGSQVTSYNCKGCIWKRHLTPSFMVTEQ